MGCYNLTCAISGMPIKEADPVVVFSLSETTNDKDDTIHSQYFIGSIPIYASYNDYGGIDTITSSDEDVSLFEEMTGRSLSSLNENDIHIVMMMHQLAYETVIGTKQMGSEGHWTTKRRQEVIDRLQQAVARMPSSLDVTPEEKLNFGKMAVRSDWFRAWGGPESVYVSDNPWDIMVDNLEISSRYAAEVSPIELWSNTYGYRIMPSLYANQGVELDRLTKLNEVRNEILETHKKYYDE